MSVAGQQTIRPLLGVNSSKVGYGIYIYNYIRREIEGEFGLSNHILFLQRPSGLVPLALSRRNCLRWHRLRIKRFTLPVGPGTGINRGSGLDPGKRLVEVYFAILDCIDDGPAIGGHARVEAHVYVGFTDIASEDVYGT